MMTVVCRLEIVPKEAMELEIYLLAMIATMSLVNIIQIQVICREANAEKRNLVANAEEALTQVLAAT